MVVLTKRREGAAASLYIQVSIKIIDHELSDTNKKIKKHHARQIFYTLGAHALIPQSPASHILHHILDRTKTTQGFIHLITDQKNDFFSLLKKVKRENQLIIQKKLVILK